MKAQAWLALAVLVAAGAVVPGTAVAAPTPVLTGVVQAGQARFEVVTPTLVRLEYAADGRFEDRESVNTQVRGAPAPAYEVSHEGGWLLVRTAALTVRYAEGSGPFGADNLGVDLTVAGIPTTAHPTWPDPPGHCRFGTRCEAEDGPVTGGLSVNYAHSGFSGRGYVSDHGQRGATTSLTVTDVPAAGAYVLRVGYANGGRRDRTVSVRVDGRTQRLTLPPTRGWDRWSTVSLPVRLRAGANPVAVRCAAGDDCGVNLDSLALTGRDAAYPSTTGTTPPTVGEPGQLGGWVRGLDVYPDQAGPLDPAAGLHPGVLNRQGWSLLDDTHTALRTADGWATPRPTRTGAYQDGYLFGYGHDYAQGLRDLRTLTGPAVMLPQWAFGVWFSAYEAISARQYEDELVPAFRQHDVPLDALSVDTDWKSPVRWDGWNFDRGRFPDPSAFMAWADGQGLALDFNVHTAISGSDPRFAQAQRDAGGRLTRAAQCFSPDCYRFDWADRRQAEAWFALHDRLERQGVRQWWLDWCCSDSTVDLAGVTPDSWINELYARHLDSPEQRGFVLARIGASFSDYRGGYASGAWGEHRSTVHFTGDSAPTWETLAYAAMLTPAEASIGQPYVSHDIGSFLGRHLPDDLYARWVQLGTFQPVLRLHSHHGDRLPWQYDEAAAPAADFLRLREALVPYTYSLAWQARQTGLPITRPLYLDSPEEPEAYDHPDEYLYGPDVLVAPIVGPGTTATRQVWFPPGRWVDWFTGQTHVGPATESVTVGLDRMPVYVRGGAVVPETPGADQVRASPDRLTLRVFSGADPSSSTLHTDAGEGDGITRGESADTQLGYAARPGHWWRRPSSTVSIGAANGTFGGAVDRRGYDVDLVAVSRPREVTVDGLTLPETVADAVGPGWSYDDASATLHVRTDPLDVTQPHTVHQRGGRVLDR